MLLKKPEFIIPPSPGNPFENCKLDRDDCAKYLTKIISSLDEPFVMAVSSKWGGGKTTFMKMWQQKLAQENYISFYFNAWKNDYVTDPLLSFIVEMQKSIKAENWVHSDLKDEAARQVKTITNVGFHFVKRALITSAKIGTVNALDIDKEIEKYSADLAGEAAEKFFALVERQSNEQEKFETELRKLVDLANNNNDLKSQVIIFVDELDRCRPDFAVKLLERIKHFFGVNGIVFVLGIDKDQLCESIKGFYGSGLNAELYLKRFIDLEYRLPISDSFNLISSWFTLYDYGSYFDERKNVGNSKNDMISTFCAVSKALELTPRDQEQGFTYLTLIFRITPIVEDLHEMYLVLLILLFLNKHDIYKKYVLGNLDAMELENEIFRKSGVSQYIGSIDGKMLSAYLKNGMLEVNELGKKINDLDRYLIDNRSNSQSSMYQDIRLEFTVCHRMFDSKINNSVGNYIDSKINEASRFAI